MHYSAVISAALMIAKASSHTIFCQLKTDQQTYDVNAANMACNGPPNPTTPSSKIIEVKAGSTTLTALIAGSNDVMDPGHKGPVMAYLKKVTDATQDSGVGNGWFKIQEAGFSNGVWGTDTVINSGGNQQIRIPECIEDGQYLLRAEMVALHGARSVNGAQLYMECAQINITGGKATKKPTTTSIPGIYKSNDPGLLIDIYNKPPSGSNPYKIPDSRFIIGLSRILVLDGNTRQRRNGNFLTRYNTHGKSIQQLTSIYSDSQSPIKDPTPAPIDSSRCVSDSTSSFVSSGQTAIHLPDILTLAGPVSQARFGTIGSRSSMVLVAVSPGNKVTSESAVGGINLLILMASI
ncbi:hypothetical protein CIB48_g2385 [Xylaria polymorpha]|nr:hypothetical protein CIB48_g2385 [Xylaria polymorpha]